MDKGLIERQAKGLLAAEMRKMGFDDEAAKVMAGGFVSTNMIGISLRALEKALADVEALKAKVTRLENPCLACNATGRFDFRDHSHRCKKCGGTGTFIVGAVEQKNFHAGCQGVVTDEIDLEIEGNPNVR